MRYLPDTNILIGVITGRKPYGPMLKQFVIGATCPIVIAEIYAGMRPAEEPKTQALLESFEFLPVTFEIARQAGSIKRDFTKSKGRVLAFTDAMIAAVAMAYRCVLVTENAKDFEIRGLSVLVPRSKLH